MDKPTTKQETQIQKLRAMPIEKARKDNTLNLII